MARQAAPSMGWGALRSEVGMKRSLLIVGVALTATLVSPRIEIAPTAAERFALELQACAEAADGKPGKCELYGKIKYVEHFADVKVEVVEHFADIEVKVVEHFADGPGKWQLVEHFPDYEVQIVDHFGEYKIKFVEHFPGCD